MGSEMCIRDRPCDVGLWPYGKVVVDWWIGGHGLRLPVAGKSADLEVLRGLDELTNLVLVARGLALVHVFNDALGLPGLHVVQVDEETSVPARAVTHLVVHEDLAEVGAEKKNEKKAG